MCSNFGSKWSSPPPPPPPLPPSPEDEPHIQDAREAVLINTLFVDPLSPANCANRKISDDDMQLLSISPLPPSNDEYPTQMEVIQLEVDGKKPGCAILSKIVLSVQG